MTDKKLKEISRTRIREAKILFDNQCFSGAYYLAGYSVECALKVCIAKQIKRNTIPDKKVINDTYTHNLNTLVKVAGLEKERDELEKKNSSFAINWTITKDWNESRRYEILDRIKAEELYKAITSRKGGVLPWIRKYW